MIPIAMISLERFASILEQIDRLTALGVEDFADLTPKKAAGPEHIRHVDLLHPLKPFRLDLRVNSYLDAIDNHKIRSLAVIRC